MVIIKKFFFNLIRIIVLAVMLQAIVLLFAYNTQITIIGSGILKYIIIALSAYIIAVINADINNITVQKMRKSYCIIALIDFFIPFLISKFFFIKIDFIINDIVSLLIIFLLIIIPNIINEIININNK